VDKFTTSTEKINESIDSNINNIVSTTRLTMLSSLVGNTKLSTFREAYKVNPKATVKFLYKQ
jgi:hypothetical protein